MKRIVALSCGLVLASVFATGQELTKEAKIERILALESSSMGDMKSLFASMIPPGLTPEEAAKAREMPQRILDLTKNLWITMRPQLVTVYSETFSAEEIDGILAFYQSPAGHALLDKRPVIMSKTMALLMPEIQRLAKEAITQK